MTQPLNQPPVPQPPLPQPQLDPTGITFEQYEEYTLGKLELCDGFYEYGGQDVKGFHLAVLTNMGIREAVRSVPLSLWIQAIEEVALESGKLNWDTEMGETMLDRFNHGIDHLQAVAAYLAEESLDEENLDEESNEEESSLPTPTGGE